MELIDSHHHLWLIDKTELGWLSAQARAERGPLIADFGLNQMAEAFGPVGVTGSVLIEAWHRDPDVNHWLREAEGCGSIGAVIAWAPLDSPDLDRRLDRYGQFGKYRGLRLNSQDEQDPDFLQRADIGAGIEKLAARTGSTLDLLIKLGDLKDVPDLCRRFAELPMVLDHLAKPQTYQPGYFEDWSKLMRPLVDIPNIVFKLSGMLTEAGPDPEIGQLARPIRFMLENFGPEKLMWGSDWPVCLNANSYAKTYELMVEAIGPLTDSERCAIFSQTARSHYQIG